MSETVFSTLVAGLFGLVIGSFLNVVVYRVPAGLSVVAPASACPRCNHAIRRRDNVPVLSWLVLRGRCRDCGAGISARYPAVELGTALLFALVGSTAASPFAGIDATQSTGRAIVLVAFLYLMAVSVALALIDLDVHRLPNAIVYPSFVVLLVLFAGASAVTGDWEALLRALAGSAVLGVGYLVLAFTAPNAMGLGDVKLAFVLGLALAYLGWGPLAVGAFGAFMVGGTVAIALLTLRLVRWRGGVPFGPSMLAGAWVGILFGDRLWASYLALLGLA